MIEFTPITDLGLSSKSKFNLGMSGIDSIEQLMRLSDKDIHKIPNLGMENVREIKKSLLSYNKAEALPRREKTEILKDMEGLIVELESLDSEPRHQKKSFEELFVELPEILTRDGNRMIYSVESKEVEKIVRLADAIITKLRNFFSEKEHG